MHRTNFPTTKNYLAQDVNSAEIEKTYGRQIYQRNSIRESRNKFTESIDFQKSADAIHWEKNSLFNKW